MMNLIKLLVAATIATVISPSVVSAWSASLTLYQDAQFRGPSYVRTFTGDDTYTCYSLSCFNDLASSATWSGIPKSNAIGGPIHIQFYTDAFCHGTKKRWKSTDPFPTNFQIDGINDQVSSFMITEIEERFDRYKGCSNGRLLSDVTASNATEATI